MKSFRGNINTETAENQESAYDENARKSRREHGPQVRS